jgi:hypothetical protein
MTYSAVLEPVAGSAGRGPEGFGHRTAQPPLTRAAVTHLGGALVVHLGTPEPVPGTRGSRQRGVHHRPSPARTVAGPELPGHLHERVRRWWRLDRQLDDWVRLPAGSPRLLLAVGGPDDDLCVEAALTLDPCGWAAAAAGRRPYGFYELPTSTDPDGVTPRTLDHLGLRGRRLAAHGFGAPRTGGGRAFAGAFSRWVDVVG